MLPEGMVHALEQIHRLLVPGGNLVDIHPALDPMLVEIHRGDSILYSQPDPISFAEDYRKADQALAQVVQRGLFIPSESRQFTFMVYASSVGELCEYLDRVNAHKEPSPEDVEAAREKEFFRQVDAIMQTLGEGVVVATRERARVALYTAGK
jgi:hypothetical protein